MIAPIPGCQCFLTAPLGGVFSSPSCCVDSRKRRRQKPCLFLRRRNLLVFLFGASRLRVNKDAVVAARDALLRSVTAPAQPVALLSERPPPHTTFSSVCSMSMEFREQCWSACPSRTPSAFTASTHCAGGECCGYGDSHTSDSRIFKRIDLQYFTGLN